MQGNPSQCLYISIISGGILPFSANSGKSRSFCFCSYVINNKRESILSWGDDSEALACVSMTSYPSMCVKCAPFKGLCVCLCV